MSEACFLLRTVHDGSSAVMELLARGVLKISFRLDEEQETVARLLTKYASVPMDLADACLVRMSEQHAHSLIFTVDSDFHLYRRFVRQTISTIMPEGV